MLRSVQKYPRLKLNLKTVNKVMCRLWVSVMILSVMHLAQIQAMSHLALVILLLGLVMLLSVLRMLLPVLRILLPVLLILLLLLLIPLSILRSAQIKLRLILLNWVLRSVQKYPRLKLNLKTVNKIMCRHWVSVMILSVMHLAQIQAMSHLALVILLLVLRMLLSVLRMLLPVLRILLPVLVILLLLLLIPLSILRSAQIKLRLILLNWVLRSVQKYPRLKLNLKTVMCRHWVSVMILSVMHLAQIQAMLDLVLVILLLVLRMLLLGQIQL